MPRAFWKGSISFGLVSIPVALVSAESSDELSFHQLDRRDLNPIGYKRVNKKTDEEVPWEQIVRGYEYDRGRFVVVTDQDIKRANVEATQTIDIVGFVEAGRISPLYFERPYYVEPGQGGAKAYALLRETLRRTGRVGLATVVIRSKQHLAALLERDGVLVLELLRWAHELRTTKGLEVPDARKARVTKQEADMATQLVKGMEVDWDPRRYKDTFTDDVMALIKKRIASGRTNEIDESEPPAPKRGGKVVDLMPLLKKSLEAGGNGRASGRGGHGRRTPARAAARAHAPAGGSGHHAAASRRRHAH
ncbi:MAG TPA: Ku protein [Candidatus Polarisedimenticolia bacterium]|jgi:DNA end-binding protein Ku|nr:Ku protein [Candidatus Polarisedimenticolia bacterium]